MKKICFALVVIAVAILAAGTANAAVFAGQNNYVLPSAETVDSNLYVSGGNVNVSGIANEDAFLAGGSISVTGKVAKDLFVVGGNINISNEIGGDLRMMGGNISIGSKIAGETMVAGGQISILLSAVLNRQVYIAGGQLVLDGTINGNAVVKGDSVEIYGTINGNVDIETQKLVVGNNAVINGVLKYKSPTEIIVPATAKIQSVEYTKSEVMVKKAANNRYGMFALAQLFRFIGTAIIALILFFIFRKGSSNLVLNIFSGFWKKVFAGFAVLILLPISGILVAITLVGIPLSMIAGLIYILFSVLSGIGAGAVLGTWLFSLFNKNKTNKYQVSWVTVLAGSFALFLFGLIPFIGWLVYTLFFLALFGQLFLVLFEGMKKAR
jgi:cytoskeletal protein CcmA (bactofilin family)